MKLKIKRFIAFIIDIFIVSIISETLSTVSFINIYKDQYIETYDEYQEIYEEFSNEDITLEEYNTFIKEILPNSKIIASKSFLQKGYEENLLPKINIYDENMNVVPLPDSTSIIVIEKEK